MKRTRVLWLCLVAYVLGSSASGLASAMATAGPRIVGIVWGASLLGDVVFVAGMSGVGIGAFHLAEGRRKAAGLALGALGSWLVYTLAWSITAPAINPQNNRGFASAGPEVWGFTLQWGWPGLVYSCVFPVLAAHLLKARAQTETAAQREEPKRHP